MRKLALSIVFAVAATGAVAQSAELDWKSRLDQAYYGSHEEIFALIGDDVYAVGPATRTVAGYARGHYVFWHCGGTLDYKYLSSDKPADVEVLKRINFVDQADPRYASLKKIYIEGCAPRGYKDRVMEWLKSTLEGDKGQI